MDITGLIFQKNYGQDYVVPKSSSPLLNKVYNACTTIQATLNSDAWYEMPNTVHPVFYTTVG